MPLPLQGERPEVAPAIKRVRATKGRSKRRAKAERTLAELRSLPVVGPKLTDDDLYGADGLPK